MLGRNTHTQTHVSPKQPSIKGCKTSILPRCKQKQKQKLGPVNKKSFLLTHVSTVTMMHQATKISKSHKGIRKILIQLVLNTMKKGFKLIQEQNLNIAYSCKEIS